MCQLTSSMDSPLNRVSADAASPRLCLTATTEPLQQTNQIRRNTVLMSEQYADSDSVVKDTNQHTDSTTSNQPVLPGRCQ